MSFIINPYQFGVALHPRLVAWLARGTALGYTLPSAAQQLKLNTFFNALDSAGIITGVASSLLDVLYIFAIDGSSDMATLNVITPASFQISKVNSPTFTTNVGFNGNGSTSYLNTNWAPNTNGVNYTQNDASFFVYYNSNVDEGSFDGADTGVRLMIAPRFSNLIRVDINQGGGTINAANASSIGLYHAQRTASNLESVYKNGVLAGSNTTASTGRPGTLFVLARNIGSPGSFSTKQTSFVGGGASLTGRESALYTAWNNYFTSL